MGEIDRLEGELRVARENMEANQGELSSELERLKQELERQRLKSQQEYQDL
jgi:hypothetical protein